MMTLLILLPVLIYGLLLVLVAIGYWKHPRPSKDNLYQDISIIVAARNEEDNLASLVHCLDGQDYPKEHYEIIIVDDRSTDNTPLLLKSYAEKIPNLRIAHIEKENPDLIGKKNALNTGIELAKFDTLAFTDADCLPPETWLSEIDRHIGGDTDMLAGYSTLLITGHPFPSLLKNFERTVYAAIADGSFGWRIGITCTATNFVYRKSLFHKVNGFDSIGHIRSGDDDLMMLKMMRYTRNVNYMTSPGSSVPSKYSLRLDSHMALETRRASKFRYYPLYLKLIAFLVFAFYLYFSTAFIMSLSGLLSMRIFLIMLFIKTLCELLFVVPFLVKVKKIRLLWAYPVLLVYYPFHFLFFALKGTFGRYRWKEN